MRVLVEIDLKNHTLTDYQHHLGDFHPTGDMKQISIDRAYLPEDPTDDSFVLLRLKSILP